MVDVDLNLSLSWNCSDLRWIFPHFHWPSPDCSVALWGAIYCLFERFKSTSTIHPFLLSPIYHSSIYAILKYPSASIHEPSSINISKFSIVNTYYVTLQPLYRFLASLSFYIFRLGWCQGEKKERKEGSGRELDSRRPIPSLRQSDRERGIRY